MRESSRWEKNGENNPSREPPVWAPYYLIKREIILFLTSENGEKVAQKCHGHVDSTTFSLLSRNSGANL